MSSSLTHCTEWTQGQSYHTKPVEYIVILLLLHYDDVWSASHVDVYPSSCRVPQTVCTVTAGGGCRLQLHAAAVCHPG